MFEQRFDNQHHLVKNKKKRSAKEINLSTQAAKVKAAEKAKANKFDKFTEQSKQFELQ